MSPQKTWMTCAFHLEKLSEHDVENPIEKKNGAGVILILKAIWFNLQSQVWEWNNRQSMICH